MSLHQASLVGLTLMIAAFVVVFGYIAITYPRCDELESAAAAACRADIGRSIVPVAVVLALTTSTASSVLILLARRRGEQR